METTPARRRRVPGVVAFLVFLAGVNLLAGGLAVALDYPSLYGVEASFEEYALPLPYRWALAHWPSMLVFGVPLLFLTGASAARLRSFRWFCLLAFGLSLAGLEDRVPFLLFPGIDAAVALLLSLVLVPPRRETSPTLFAVVVGAVLLALGVSAVVGYSAWQHRTPRVTTSAYVDGAFELGSIVVSRPRRELRFEVELVVPRGAERPAIVEVCALGQRLAGDLLRDYPFDRAYHRYIEVWFDPGSAYRLGEISLDEAHRVRDEAADGEGDGRFACALSYREDGSSGAG